jgi:thymidylate synthase
MSVDGVWRGALARVLNEGHEVSPTSAGSAWRGRRSKEVLALQTVVPMDRPVLVNPVRKLNHRFMAAEAAWILSGDNRVASIAPFNRKIKDFSDDGRTFAGAYGPKFAEQRAYVTATLLADPASRQAVIGVWRERPGPSKDVPCTLSWQLIRRGHVLHCVATMRSSDLWFGWPYDVFNFSMVAAAVLLDLQQDDPGNWGTTTLGKLYLTAGSQHLYALDWKNAQAAVDDEQSIFEPAPLVLHEFIPPVPLMPDHWTASQGLIDHLWTIAKDRGAALILPTHSAWLTDLYR